MTQTLRARILLVTALGAVVCAGAAVVTTVLTLAALSASRLGDLAETVGPRELAACEQAPEAWAHQEGLFRIWAYDLALSSHNRWAPEIPLGLRAAPVGAARTAPMPDGPAWRRGAVQRVADGGPCAVLFAMPLYETPLLPYLRGALLAGGFLGMGFALLGSLGFLVRPLIRRLERIDVAAGSVGDEGRFHRVHDEGRDELGRIATTLDNAHRRIVADRAELERRHRILEEHLAGLAHDLRTPLASLQLTLESVAEGVEGPLHRSVGAARMEVAYLEALADNLHQASRLSAGVDVHQGASVDWTAVVDRVALRFAILGRAQDKQVVAATPDAPVWASGSRAMAERALSNLVHNALVHGGTHVGVALDTVDEGSAFRIVLQDDGPGLDAEAVASWSGRRLRTRQPDPSRSRSPGQGLGLGLAIVNEIAERAGWTVTYAARADGGLRVEVQGPLRGAPDLASTRDQG